MSAIKTTNDRKIKDLLLSMEDSYKRETKYFIEYLDKNKLTFSLKGLKEYYKYLQDPGNNLSNKSQRLYLSAAKHRFRYIVKKSPDFFNMIKLYKIKEALSELKPPKIQNNSVTTDKILTADEIDTLMASSPEWLSLMVKMLFVSGLRISELLNIRLKNIRSIGEHYKIRIKGKGNKERFIEIDKHLIKEIKKYYKGNEYLFENDEGLPYKRETISMKIKRIGWKVLFKDISAHTLRHSFATIMINKTGKIKAVSNYLGHSSSSITLDMYVHENLLKKDFDLINR